MKRLLVALLCVMFMLPAVAALADEGGDAKPAAKTAKVKKGKGGKKGGGGKCEAKCKAGSKLLMKRASWGTCKVALRKWVCSKEDQPVLRGKRGGGKKAGGKKSKAEKPEKGAAEKTE